MEKRTSEKIGCCCDMMTYHTQLHCSQHNDVFECPDVLIFHSNKKNKSEKYGIIVHNGGGAPGPIVVISFCPWCGKKLEEND